MNEQPPNLIDEIADFIGDLIGKAIAIILRGVLWILPVGVLLGLLSLAYRWLKGD